MWSALIIAIFFEILLIQRCSCRWNFYDTNGRRIRHRRYWKLENYQQDGRCALLANIPNGSVRVTHSNQPGATAIYKCNKGYRLQGQQQRMCMSNGRWTGATPKCISLSYCGPPPNIDRATHDAEPSQQRFLSDSTVRYRCQDGFYFPSGFAQAVCRGKDSWIGPEITCRPISCGHPGILNNGRRIGNEFFFKKKVVFLCDEGFKVSCEKSPGSKEKECQVRVCQANGKWSGNQPKCTPIRCPSLKEPKHGRVSGMWTKVNSILTFSCNPGYYLVGSRTRRCQHHGEWDGVNATCRIWNCGLPPFVPHSRLNYTNTIFGSRATYRCIPNSSFSGESEILECGPDGIWTPESPKCLSHCPVLKVTNGTIHVDNVTFKGDVDSKRKMIPHAVTVRVQCADGYHLRELIFPRCQNGSWSINPICDPAPCKQRPPVGINAQARFYSLKHGAKAQYACYLGYHRASGDNTLQCQYGQWLGTAPVCKPTSCKRPLTPKNGRIYLIGTNGRWPYTSPSIRPRHDDLIEYRCQEGYRIKGQPNAVCMNGEWRPTETPECEAIRHKRLPIEWVLYKPRRYVTLQNRR